MKALRQKRVNAKYSLDFANCHIEEFMEITAFRWLLLSGLLLSSSLAGAQSVSTDGTAVQKAAEPASFQLQYFSVFTRYQYFRDQPLLSWQETNDNVGKIGGWRFYARDAMPPGTSTSADETRPDSDKKETPGLNEKSGQKSGQGSKP